jgi:Putative phage serine protease XkdF
MANPEVDSTAKLEKDDPRVSYMDPESGPFECNNCVHFDPKGYCEIVSGSIQAEGCCNLYNPGAKRAKPEAAAKSITAAIAKVDSIQGVVYGWGNVCVDENGLVTDRQGDQWEPDELEKSVVDFMLNCRNSGEMHEGGVTGTVVASLVTTPDIVKSFFGPDVSVPVGWIIGVKVDKATLQKVIDGQFRAFSIQGSGDRIPV